MANIICMNVECYIKYFMKMLYRHFLNNDITLSQSCESVFWNRLFEMICKKTNIATLNSFNAHIHQMFTNANQFIKTESLNWFTETNWTQQF